MAKLHFRYGAMNSGKTRMLLSTAHNYREVGSEVLIVKPMIDLKGGEKIQSRAGEELAVDLLLGEEDAIYPIVETWEEKLGCILVDEAQFLQSGQVDELLKIVVRLRIPVIAFGLRIDFRREMFPGSKRLLELSHSIRELKTICWNNCGRKAVYNARLLNGEFTREGEQVAIDGLDAEYHSLCAHCYDELVLQSLQ